MADGFAATVAVKLLDYARLKSRHIERRLGRSLPPRGFFDDYPRFFETSATNARQNRLNERYRACIASNEAIIRGKRVLDLASHDGRWSFAACRSGALHVLGIEARKHLVDSSNSVLPEYGVPADRFRFVLGDMFEELDRIEPGSVDTVFCFGFFYHTLEHLALLSKIARIAPKHVVLDTNVSLDRDALIRIEVQEVAIEGDAVAIPGRRLVLGGAPSRSALDLMLRSFGWSWSYYDWHGAGIRCWDDIGDYHDGGRITLTASVPPA